MPSERPSFDDIAATLGMADVGLDPRGQRRALTLLRTLAEGEPVAPATLGERTGQPAEEAAAFIDALTGVYRDDAGDVIGFWGLTVADMPPHRYRVGGRDLHTWCAWDPFILTPWLGGEAQVSSADARTGEPVSFRFADGAVRDLSHEDLTLSFTLPDEWGEDVIATFCHFIHFFSDEASAVVWTDANPGTFVLSLADAIELGRVWGRQVLPDVEAPA